MSIAVAIPFMARDLSLSPLEMGQALSAFFVGYALMQIPGGVLADRFGSRILLTASIAAWSVMTAATGAVQGLWTLLAIRVLFGLGEGPYPSAAAKALSIWFPSREVGRANGLQLAATHLGATVAPLLAVGLIVTWGWRSIFYVISVPGFFLAVLVWRHVRNTPIESRQVGPLELKELDAAPLERFSAKVGLLQALHTPAVLWCAGALFIANLAGWGLINWLPTYLLRSRQFGVVEMGIYTAVTNLATTVGFALGGYLCDRFFTRRLRVPMVLSLIVSAIFTYLAAAAATGEASVVYLALSCACQGVALTAMFTLPMIVMPKYAVGAAFGFVNTAGQLAGVLSPVVIGDLLNRTHNNFVVVLYCIVGVKVLAAYPASRIRQFRGGSPNAALTSQNETY
jgi:sugar phosphate permease